MQLGDLIRQPYNLDRNGVLIPDNFVTMFVATTGFLSLIAYSMNAIAPDPTFDLEFYASLALVGSTIAGLVVTTGRYTSLPTEQAQYLDQKIEELF